MSRGTIFRRQKNLGRGYRPKITGILFVCNEPGRSIPYCAQTTARRCTLLAGATAYISGVQLQGLDEGRLGTMTHWQSAKILYAACGNRYWFQRRKSGVGRIPRRTSQSTSCRNIQAPLAPTRCISSTLSLT